MEDAKALGSDRSRLGKDLLGPLAVESVDRSSSDEPVAVNDGVRRGAGAVPSGSRDCGPDDFDAITSSPTGAFENRPGNDPLEDEIIVGPAVDDRDEPGILQSDRVHAVDDVAAAKAGPAGYRGRGETSDDEESEEEGADTAHSHDQSIGDLVPPWLRWAGAIVGLLAMASLAFAVFEPIQVLPRIRVAPGFALLDQRGDSFTSEDGRGNVTLFAFGYGDCGEVCDQISQTMQEVGRRTVDEVDLGEQSLQLVTVSFDPDRDAPRLDELAAAAGADGDRWRWVTSEEGNLGHTLSAGFGLWYQAQADNSFEFDPRFVLVDGWGVVRGEYRYTTLAGDADKLVRHIGLLGSELRNAHGATALAYEAAHVFLCYP